MPTRSGRPLEASCPELRYPVEHRVEHDSVCVDLALGGQCPECWAAHGSNLDSITVPDSRSVHEGKPQLPLLVLQTPYKRIDRAARGRLTPLIHGDEDEPLLDPLPRRRERRPVRGPVLQERVDGAEEGVRLVLRQASIGAEDPQARVVRKSIEGMKRHIRRQLEDVEDAVEASGS